MHNRRSHAASAYGSPPSRSIYAYLTGFQGSRWRGGTPGWAQRPFERNADGSPKFRPAWDVMDDPSGSVFAGACVPCGVRGVFQPSALGDAATVDWTALFETGVQVAQTVAGEVAKTKAAKAEREAAEKEAAHQRRLAKIQAEAAAKAQVAAASRQSQAPMWIAGGAVALGALALLAAVLRPTEKPAPVGVA